MDYMKFGADHLKNDRAILLGVDVPQTTEGLRLVQPSHLLPDIQSKRAGPANNFWSWILMVKSPYNDWAGWAPFDG